MITITIRDKEVAESQSSPYLVLVTADATAFSAYKTVEEFMLEWHDSLSQMKLNSLNFQGQKALVLTADYSVKTVYAYSKELDAMKDKTRACKLLSNGSVSRGAILVDGGNRQTTFFRLNPNDKKAN